MGAIPPLDERCLQREIEVVVPGPGGWFAAEPQAERRQVAIPIGECVVVPEIEQRPLDVATPGFSGCMGADKPEAVVRAIEMPYVISEVRAVTRVPAHRVIPERRDRPGVGAPGVVDSGEGIERVTEPLSAEVSATAEIAGHTVRAH